MTNSFHGKILVTLDDLGYQSSLNVIIEYLAQPAEPMVRYLPDGSGYPGCPSSAELLGVHVTSWIVGDEVRLPSVLNDDRKWSVLEAIARKVVVKQWSSMFEDMCLEDANDYSERE